VWLILSEWGEEPCRHFGAKRRLGSNNCSGLMSQIQAHVFMYGVLCYLFHRGNEREGEGNGAGSRAVDGCQKKKTLRPSLMQRMCATCPLCPYKPASPRLASLGSLPLRPAPKTRAHSHAPPRLADSGP
jgi:hypothetical protein